jgi:hypothetical protein
MAEPHSARRALRCAITAYHLHEWVWSDWLSKDYNVWKKLGIRDLESFVDWIDRACVWFRGVQDLANGTKHFIREQGFETSCFPHGCTGSMAAKCCPGCCRWPWPVDGRVAQVPVRRVRPKRNRAACGRCRRSGETPCRQGNSPKGCPLLKPRRWRPHSLLRRTRPSALVSSKRDAADSGPAE